MQLDYFSERDHLNAWLKFQLNKVMKFMKIRHLNFTKIPIKNVTLIVQWFRVA